MYNIWLGGFDVLVVFSRMSFSVFPLLPCFPFSCDMPMISQLQTFLGVGMTEYHFSALFYNLLVNSPENEVSEPVYLSQPALCALAVLERTFGGEANIDQLKIRIDTCKLLANHIAIMFLKKSFHREQFKVCKRLESL